MRIRNIIALTAAVVVMLSGCSGIEKKPKFVDFPLYPEQNVSEPTYSENTGIDTTPSSYTSEGMTNSATITSVIQFPETLSREFRDNNHIFDISPVGKGNPAIVTVSYKSNTPAYFVALSANGEVVDAIASPKAPGRFITVIGADYSSPKVAAIQVFGTGSWSIDIAPVSSLPVFDGKEIGGTGDMAFLSMGERTRVDVTSAGAGLRIFSFGEKNRVIVGDTGGGSRTEPTSIPGNGSIILVNYPGEWTIKEAPIVEQTKEK